MSSKFIAEHWMDYQWPSVQKLINKVDWPISMEKGIYLKRELSSKYEKIWAKWMNTPGLAIVALIRNRLLGFSC